MAEPRPLQDTPKDAESALHLQEFVRLLTESQGRLRAFIVSLMPGSPDVGDVLQETNLTLWNSRARFEMGTNFLAWCFTVARLEVLHQRARAKRRGSILVSDALVGMLAEEMPETVDHEAYLCALEGCLSKLTGDQRELVEARYQPGHSLEAHAQITGRKASALRVALMRIRTVLRECVENSMNGKFA